MAFLSGAGREGEFGSGGKILRGRRHLTGFSPYSRPSSSAAPLALLEPGPKAGRSPSWFRGLISGAGKLISSVLGSEGSGSSASECSSDYSSDEEFDHLPDEDEDQFFSDDFTGFNKRERVVEGNVESLAMVSKSESKLIIEQLLLQETFTREEYSKLMEILQSRVLDSPSAEGGEGFQKDISERVSEKRPWQSLNLNRNISGPSNVSASNLSAFSPRYYVSEAVTPDLLSRAAMEAKNWLEEKKLSPRPIFDQEYGPCRLNTDMNQHYFYGEGGSPIEMAKSYMQSLPPWRSPSFSTTGFKNSTSSGKRSSFSTGGHSLLTSKAKTKDYSSIGSFRSSQVPLKVTADDQGSSKLKPLFEVSRILTATINSGNKIQDEPLRLHDRDVIEVDHLMNKNKEVSQGNIVVLPEALKEAQEIPKIAAENVIEQLNSDIETLPGDADIFMSDKNQDAELPTVIEAHNGSISAPHDSLFMSSMASGNDGHSFPETETFQPANAIPAEPSTRISKEEKFQTDIAMKANHDSDFFKHAHSIIDSQPPDDIPHNPKETIRAAEETNNTNGNFEENNTNSGLESMNKVGTTTTNSGDGNDAVTASGSEGTRGHPSDVSSDIPSTKGIGSNSNNPQNGTKMKSIERVITEPSKPGRGKRKAKTVARQKRWKG